MKVILISIDNGESYEDNQVLPVVVCANKQKAIEYIDTHPITGEVFESIFHYKIYWTKNPKYVFDEVEVYQ